MAAKNNFPTLLKGFQSTFFHLTASFWTLSTL